MMNFVLKTRKLCIKITRKRGIVYPNHTNTRNFVFKMMKFAGQQQPAVSGQFTIQKMQIDSSAENQGGFTEIWWFLVTALPRLRSLRYKYSHWRNLTGGKRGGERRNWQWICQRIRAREPGGSAAEHAEGEQPEKWYFSGDKPWVFWWKLMDFLLKSWWFLWRFWSLSRSTAKATRARLRS